MPLDEGSDLRRTVSGAPTAEQTSARSAIASAIGSNRRSRSSTGRGSGPGLPVRRLTKACSSDERKCRASASLSAAKTLIASISFGAASQADGRNDPR